MTSDGDLRPLRLSLVEEPRPPLGWELRVEVQEQLCQPVVNAVRSGHAHQLRAIDTVDDLQTHLFEAIRVGAACASPWANVVLVYETDHVVAQAGGLLLHKLVSPRAGGLGREARQEHEQLAVRWPRRVEPDVVVVAPRVGAIRIAWGDPVNVRIGFLRRDGAWLQWRRFGRNFHR